MLWTIKYLGRKEEIELRKEIYLYVSSSQKHLWEVVHKTPNMRMFLSVPLALYWTAEWLSEHQGIQPQLLDIIHLRYHGGHGTGNGTPSLLGYSSGTVFTLLRPSPDSRGRVCSEMCLWDAAWTSGYHLEREAAYHFVNFSNIWFRYLLNWSIYILGTWKHFSFFSAFELRLRRKGCYC